MPFLFFYCECTKTVSLYKNLTEFNELLDRAELSVESGIDLELIRMEETKFAFDLFSWSKKSYFFEKQFCCNQFLYKFMVWREAIYPIQSTDREFRRRFKSKDFFFPILKFFVLSRNESSKSTVDLVLRQLSDKAAIFESLRKCKKFAT